MKETPLVSILCITYNHEKYIRQAIDSFLMQKTTFLYEILIHDDASSDNTAKIIEEYAYKYPRIIRTVLQHENQYSKGISGTNILMKMAKGKYIAICEGDDYWTDPQKLQQQVDILENQKACVACCHNEIVVNHNCEPLSDQYQRVYREETDVIHDISYLKNYCKFCHTASLLLRANIINDMSETTWKKYTQCKANGDMKWAALIAANGKIYHIAKDMACYRFVCNSGDSWSAQTRGKNITHSTFVQLERIRQFVLNEYGVNIDYSSYYDKLLFQSLQKYLKSRSKDDGEIFVNLLEETNTLFISCIRLIFYIMQRGSKKIIRVFFHKEEVNADK